MVKLCPEPFVDTYTNLTQEFIGEFAAGKYINVVIWHFFKIVFNRKCIIP